VFIFVWALIVAYVIGSDLKPELSRLALLAFSGYLLSFGVYVLNSLSDLKEDRINAPNRPLPAGKVTVTEAKIIIISTILGSLLLSAFISVPTVALYSVCLFLGLAYSIPRIRAKRFFQFKIIIPVSGAAVFSLAGGSAAQIENPAIFYAAITFALFAMVTLLLGDIADVRGDFIAGIISLPMVIGEKKSVYIITLIPLVLCGMGAILFVFGIMNFLFPLAILGISIYTILNLRKLLDNHDNKIIPLVKSRMRYVHLILQVSFILGLLVL
jgi:geranylgeranylglycerol-phosphate geranylgeranyltransferase